MTYALQFVVGHSVAMEFGILKRRNVMVEISEVCHVPPIAQGRMMLQIALNLQVCRIILFLLIYLFVCHAVPAHFVLF